MKNDPEFQSIAISEIQPQDLKYNYDEADSDSENQFENEQKEIVKKPDIIDIAKMKFKQLIA